MRTPCRAGDTAEKSTSRGDPSFDVDDPKDTRRLLQGYTEARRAGRFARPGSEVLAELRRAIEVH